MELEQTEMELLVDALLGATEETAQAKLLSLRNLCHNCPACILSAIRQANIKREETNWNEELPPVFVALSWNFDFKKELAAWWEAQNNERAEKLMDEEMAWR